MTDRTHATLRVELDPQDGSIAGRLMDGEGADRPFSGWVGLAAAIEDTLQGAGRAREAKRPHRQGESWTARTRIGSDEK